jgi:hypothetical protein
MLCCVAGAVQAAMPRLGPHELLLLLLGVSCMERVPRRSKTAAAARAGWLPAAARQLQPHLSSLDPQQLSGALLAFGKLQYQPSPEWLSAYQQAWTSKQGRFSAKDHALVLWGVGFLPAAAAAGTDQLAWAQQLQAALQQSVSRPAAAVAAVALLKLRQAAQQQEGSTQLPAAANNAPQQQQQQQQDVQALPQPPSQQAAAAATATALQPGQQQQQQQQEEELLTSASLLHPTDCAMAVYALARLGPSSVDPEFAAFWLRQSRSQLGNMNSQELASCVWALGRLGLQPPEEWLQQHLRCSAQLAGCMSHRQLAMLLYGCARLQVGRVGVWGFAWLVRCSHDDDCVVTYSSGALPSRVHVRTSLPCTAQLLRKVPGWLCLLYEMGSSSACSVRPGAASNLLLLASSTLTIASLPVLLSTLSSCACSTCLTCW